MRPGKQALDFPTAAVTAQFTAVLGARFAAVVFMVSDQPDVLLPRRPGDRCHKRGRRSFAGPGRRETPFDGGFDEASLMRRSACNPHGDRKTMAVRNCHDLGPFAAACRPTSTAPFLAPLKEASIKVSPRSSWPRASRSSASARNSLYQHPGPHPSLEAAMAGLVGGHFLRQLRPLRSGSQIQRTPSSTARVSFQGQPRGLRRRAPTSTTPTAHR